VALPERRDETVGEGGINEVFACWSFLQRPTAFLRDDLERTLEGLQCFVESLLGVLLPVVLVRLEEFLLRASESFRIEEMKGRLV
jgi:hypothetical protein